MAALPHCVMVIGRRHFLNKMLMGMHVWLEPFEELRAPLLTNLRMDPFELAHDIGMDYDRWFIEHMYMIAPAGGLCWSMASKFQGISTKTKTGKF